MKKAEFSAIIMAAGGSTRMGKPKHLLQYGESQTFLDKLVNTFVKYGCHEVIVVFNPDGADRWIETNPQTKFRVAVNHKPESGRFSSLQQGVQSSRKSAATFVTNVDNPFVSPETLRALAERLPDTDYIYPVFEGRGGHPFLISAKVVEAIRKEKDVTQHMKDFLNRFRSRGVEVTDRNILVNINSIADYNNSFLKP